MAELRKLVGHTVTVFFVEKQHGSTSGVLSEVNDVYVCIMTSLPDEGLEPQFIPWSAILCIKPSAQ